MTTTADTAKSSAIRFKFIDGLRGVAAMLVVLFHAHGGTLLSAPLAKAMPQWLAWICDNGFCGVQIFFVISGFVIAHSLRDLRTVAEATIFVVKRQLRLDPPYWFTVFLTVGAVGLERTLHLTDHAPFCLRDVALNLFYLQDILHAHSIVGQAWTLCIEIQFYLLIVGVFLVLAKLPKQEELTNIILTSLSLCSLVAHAIWHNQIWLADHFYYFGMGALAYRYSTRFAEPCLAATILATAFCSWQAHDITMAIGTTAGVSVYCASKFNQHQMWLSSRSFQFLGSISYSLYLIHLFVAWKVIRIGARLTGDSAWSAWFWFLAAIASSIAAATIINRFIEKPSQRMAQSLTGRMQSNSIVAPQPTS